MKSKLFPILFLSILTIIIIYVFEPFDEQIVRTPSSSFSRTGALQINAEQFLASIKEGRPSNFIKKELPSQHYWDLDFSWAEVDDFYWRYDEYMTVVDAAWSIIWGDDPDLWKPYDIKFRTSCHNHPNLNLAHFIYFKPLFTESQKLVYSVRQVAVFPSKGLIVWGDGVNYPYPLPFGWKEAVKTKILSPADVIGQTMEDDYSQKDCVIDLSLFGDYWYIYYKFHRDVTLYKKVDARTGEIIER
jgi:hypothetical protein